MLGLKDFSIFLVYALCIASTLLCVVYGIVNWNKGDDKQASIKKDEAWAKEEEKLEENLG